MKNIKSKFVATASIWFINLLMITLIVVFIFQTLTIVKLYQPLEPINDLEGVKTWSTGIGLEAFDYKLMKELTYSSEQDTFQTTTSFTPSYEMVTTMSDAGCDPQFNIRNRTDLPVSATKAENYAIPVKYVYSDSDDQFWVTNTFVIGYVLSFVVVFWWFWVLRKLVRNIASQKFFISENVRQFIYLAIPLLLIPFLELFARMYFQNFFIENFQVMNGGSSRKVDFEIMPIVFGLIFLIIGGIVNEGIKMKEEQDLTI